ncbi:GNAT family N-acetyltransferase [Lysinibacillus sp. KU-BSD001]|uniref:GNAT family N-acetyltransferase n=1 Tax=Lysinibacillus sp. KU-BSD001 TaxID=3141328 RepID=UPI0036EF4995
MNFSFMTVSFPVDAETLREMKGLCEEAYKTDGVHYESILNLPNAQNYEASGFFVLVYNDEDNQLVGLASAIDLLGLNTYEWSIVVLPMYRQIGLGDAVYQVVREGLEVRGADGELALMMEGVVSGKAFLEKRGYVYSFSEATLEARAEKVETRDNVTIRPFKLTDTEALVDIFCEAFGDLQEEALELITFNSQTEGLVLWVAEENGTVVGTVTTRKEGDAHWVTALAVHPTYGGRGIGTELLNSVKQFAFSGGEQFVLLDVELDNNQALAVYQKAGFSKSAQVDYFAFGG